MKSIFTKIIILTLAFSPLSSLAVGFVTTGGASFVNPAKTNQVTFYGSAYSSGVLSGGENLLVNFAFASYGRISSSFPILVPKTCKEIISRGNYQSTPEQKLVATSTGKQFSALSAPTLQSNSIYYYCAIAKDDGFPNKTSMGEVKSFTTKAGLVNTRDVSELTQNSVVLNGVIATPTSQEWHVNFRFSSNQSEITGCGLKTGFFGYPLPYTGPFTDFLTIPKGFTGSGEFKQKLVGLNPGTTYYACAVLSTTRKSDTGYAYGETISFTTLGINPGNTGTKVDPNSASSGPRPNKIGYVETLDTANTSDTAALMRGSVSCIEQDGDCTKGSAYAYFRIAELDIPPLFCNDIYGVEKGDVEAQNDLNNPTSGGKIKAGNFQAIIYGLEPNTEYYYCAFVSNSANNNPTEIEYGEVKKMRTSPCLTCDKVAVITIEPKEIYPTSTILRGTYNTNVELKTFFEYKEIAGNTAVGSVLGGGTIIGNSDWKKAGIEETHRAKTYGKVNFTLSGLKQNAYYVARIVGETVGTKKKIYGEVVDFKTRIGSDIVIDPGPTEDPEIPPVSVDPGIDVPDVGGPVNPGGGNGPFNPYNPYDGSGGDGPDLEVGTKATPPDDALVHYREGVETVFQRQIVRKGDIARYYGYEQSEDLQTFAWKLAHDLAYEFGYVDGRGREIRVSTPDVSAYELRLNGAGTTVYEYYKGVIIDIRTTSFSFKLKNQYEYYFRKVLSVFR